MFSSVVPTEDPNLHHQKELTDISEDEFKEQYGAPVYKWYHRIFQLICFLLFLGPIRLVIGVFGFFFMSFVVLVLRKTLTLFGQSRLVCKKLAYDISIIGFRLLLFGFGHIKVKVDGEIDPEARIFISNHTGYQDPYVISVIKYISPVAKAELGATLLKDVIDCSDPIYVRRDQPGGQSKMIMARADDKASYPILIFPEGTLTRGGITLKFHRSAFLTPHKVQPMLIRYKMPFVPKGWNSYAWTNPNLLDYFFCILSIPWNTVTVTALPAITLDKEGNGSVDEFAKYSQLLVANHFGNKAVTRSSDEIFRKKRNITADTKPNEEKPKNE